eukprot:1142376-Pelagomonas_calceolata.AAC.3
MTNTGATKAQSEPPSNRICSRHRASTASMHSIHTSTQANVLPSTQNGNLEDNDTLDTPPGDASACVLWLRGVLCSGH